MNNNIQSSFSGSTSSFAKVMCGALMLGASYNSYGFQNEKEHDASRSFSLRSSPILPSTFDQNIIKVFNHESRLEDVLMQTYEKILKESVSMDADFAKYISENIEDLF